MDDREVRFRVRKLSELQEEHHGRSHLAWDLSETIARLSLALLLTVAAAVFLVSSPNIRRSIENHLPGSFVAWLNDDSTGKGDYSSSRAMRDAAISKAEQVQKDIGPATRDRSVPKFSIGSTKQQVRQIQGEPTAMSDGVWRYGESEVYFAGDRVVKWRSAPGYPLRTE